MERAEARPVYLYPFSCSGLLTPVAVTMGVGHPPSYRCPAVYACLCTTPLFRSRPLGCPGQHHHLRGLHYLMWTEIAHRRPAGRQGGPRGRNDSCQRMFAWPRQLRSGASLAVARTRPRGSGTSVERVGARMVSQFILTSTLEASRSAVGVAVALRTRLSREFPRTYGRRYRLLPELSDKQA